MSIDTSVDLENPFGADAVEDDPFATPEDVQSNGGGEFKPSPKPEDLNGALIAYVPRKYDEKAKKLERFVKPGEDTHGERWTVDLFVLDGATPGADLAFWYKKKAEQEGGPKTDAEYVIAAVNMPEMFPRTWILQAALIGQINRVADGKRPIVAGRMRRGPIAEHRRAGKTFADVEREFAEWEKRGRRGESPSFSWQVDTANSPEDMNKIRAWYAAARADGTVDLTRKIERTTERIG